MNLTAENLAETEEADRRATRANEKGDEMKNGTIR
jgi:hypothetical protein